MSTPTSQQQAAIAARGNVLVAAGAGTGKTSTVTDRCLDLVLRERCPIDQILMVTFTEAAAAEMRERLRKKLREAANSATPGTDSNLWLTEQIALLDSAAISTLHSFCLELVLRHFHLLGLDPQLVVLDESQTKPLVHGVLDQLFLKHYAGDSAPSRGVRELIQSYGRGNDGAIRNLVVQLHQHAQALANPAAWFAAQTSLFGSETPEAWREQLITATREWAQLWSDSLTESAGESSALAISHQALTRLLAEQTTFAAAQATLQDVVAADDTEWDYGTKTKVRKPFERFFDAARFLHDLAANDGAALVEDWHWSRTAMLTLLSLTQEFDAAFSEAKRDLGGIDFADQEQFALRLLLNTDGSPTSIAEACRAQFQFVFVDECQDINAAQDAVIRAISREGSDANRFLVGDVKQSIYRFRLADPRIFQSYQANWQSHTDSKQAGQVLPLTENFRSAEGLLHFINPVFRSLMRPVIGGLNYDEASELQFGAPQTRSALATANDSAPRVALHLITKSEDSSTPGEDIESNGEPSIIPDLPTTEREARLIATQLKRLKESRYPVWNRESEEGGFRSVEYSDMVVLIRGVAGRAEIFAKAFHQVGVPLLATRAGFLSAIEVCDVINLLRLLDNPLQDLPLLAVLRSPFAGLSANELAQIRIAERRGLLWSALLKISRSRTKLPNELVERISTFIKQYHRWRNLTRHSSLTHCIETTLNETCYESLLLAGERGEERVANVRRLVEMARRFDPFQREGLYRFLRFIDEQEAAEVDHEPATAQSVNAVRLMTIHASKGLEFPIVVLAGMGTRFNLRDLSGDVLLDDELGLCPKVFPPNTRTRYPSITHWLAAQRERRALLGEELRLLYVAMTRARDHLLLVGSTARQDEIERWQTPGAVTNQALLKAGYLDWLRLWFTSQSSLADWTTVNEGRNPLLTWKFWNLNDPIFASTADSSRVASSEVSTPTRVQLTQIQHVLASDYKHADAVVQPAKTTVTAIRHRLADEMDDEARRAFPSTDSVFASRKLDSRLSAAEIGTAHHTFLQFVSLKQTATEPQLRDEAAQLESHGTLSPEQIEALDFAALTAFWQSDLGQELRALPENLVNREMPFTARFQISEVENLLSSELASKELTLTPDADFVVVQGVADLAVLLPKEIWLLDFKTDHLTTDELEHKVKLYAPQLKVYALALERIFNRPVTRCCVHFLNTRQTKMIEPSACI